MFGIKQSKIGWNFAQQWLPKAKISGPADDRRPNFFRKMRWFKVAILLYESSMESKSLVKFKEAQLFYLVIKLTKPLTLPKACVRWKTKRGIGIIFFRADRQSDFFSKNALI